MDDFNNINITDTKEETDKKCPQCGGVMDFDPASGKLKCPYCDYEESIPVSEDTPKKAEELDFFSASFTANKDWGIATKTVLCKACGAESIYDSMQTSAICPFCGSNQVMEANEQDTIAPGGVVPFSISDKEAAELFKKWIKRKWFCPKLAKTVQSQNVLTEFIFRTGPLTATHILLTRANMGYNTPGKTQKEILTWKLHGTEPMVPIKSS